MLKNKLILSSVILTLMFFRFDSDPAVIKANIITEKEKAERLYRKFMFQKFKNATGNLMAVTDCFSVSDGTNVLYSIDKNNGSPIYNIGPTGVCCIEAVTTSADGQTIYAFDGDDWGTLNYTTGAFTYIGSVGTGDGAQGTITFDDVDGVAIDGRTLEYFGSERQNDGPPDDLFFQFDPLTGNIIPDAFGPGVDYVVVNTSSLPVSPTLYDVDDMGIDPLNGTVYAVTNTAGTNDRLITIDRTNGNVTDVGRITDAATLNPINDIESMSFSNDGTLFITSATTNHFYRMDKNTALATLLGTFPSGSDFEGIACLTDGSNTVAGTVFYDYNYSTIYDGGDAPSPGETVYLYEDINGDGLLDFNDELIQTQQTDANGDYLFEVAIEGDFIVAVNPGVHIMTTPDELPFTYVGVENDLVDYDFGYVCGPPLAADDYENTLQDTPVTVDVLANDLGCAALDPSTVTTTGVLQPTNGSITGINSVTGEISYQPDIGYSGIDSFQYIICDTAPISLCDTATVYITVTCSGVAGQNDMSGTVFIDADQDMVIDGGETGQSGVTVYLYEDDAPFDFIPDGPPIQTTTTNGSGAFLFTVYKSYSSSGSGSYYLTNAAHDARERNTGQTEIYRSHHRLGDDGRYQWNGWKFNNITIPAGAIITSATITFTAYRSDSGSPSNTRFWAEDNTTNPANFANCGSGCDDISDRPRTSASVDWTNIPSWSQGNSYTSPDMSTIIQEIVDDQGSLTNDEIVIMTLGLSPYNRRRVVSYDSSPSDAPVLDISYTIPGNQPYHYIMTIDETTIPAGYVLTTDNFEIAQFDFNGTADCNNDFGIYLPVTNCTTIYTNGFIRYNRLN